MPGQAALKSRAEIASTLKNLNISSQKKNPTGGDPVCHPTLSNPSLGMDGSITGKTRKVKLQSKITGY